MAAKRPAKTKSGKDIAESYNEVKSFHGQQYTGMKIGRTHKWYYDQGEWKEKKVTPDLWQFTYAVTKRRAGRAPEGSGVPIENGEDTGEIAATVQKSESPPANSGKPKRRAAAKQPPLRRRRATASSRRVP